MRRSLILAGVAAGALAAFLAGADAQQPIQRVQVGVLECRGGASIGLIVGSVTNLGCVLRVDGMPDDRYIATIRKVGVDLGITQESARARRSVRQLRRRPGQCVGRGRRRRQCAGRRLQQFDRAAAAERAGPGRPQCRGRAGKPRTAAGQVT